MLAINVTWWFCVNVTDDENTTYPAFSFPSVLATTGDNFASHARTENICIPPLPVGDKKPANSRTPAGLTRAQGSNGKNANNQKLSWFCVGEEPSWAPAEKMGRVLGQSPMQPPDELCTILNKHAERAEKRRSRIGGRTCVAIELSDQPGDSDGSNTGHGGEDEVSDSAEPGSGAIITLERGRPAREPLPEYVIYKTDQDGPLTYEENRLHYDILKRAEFVERKCTVRNSRDGLAFYNKTKTHHKNSRL